MSPVTRWSALALLWALTLTGCGGHQTIIEGRGVSMRYDPNHVAGLPASNGASGPLVHEPPSVERVRNTDVGDIDRSAMLAIEDIEDFWRQHYHDSLPGSFSPVSALVSVDPDASDPEICGSEPSELAFNAAYCRDDDLIAWDRKELLPVAKTYFGELAINGLLAHEYGHALQYKGHFADDETPTLVSEQQADCFAGTYLRWVAEGHSPRFTLNTTTALDKVLAGAIAVRDRPPEFSLFAQEASHGTALDRVGALQQGFDVGASSCAAIDMADIRARRGDIPGTLFDPASPQSDLPITTNELVSLIDRLNQLFSPSRPPSLATTSSCAQGPAAYCPETNTIAVDLSALQQLGTPASEQQHVLLQGDNSAISVVTSRYMLAIEDQQGLGVESENAALRTACLTGVAQSKMADPTGSQLVLGAGDIDEAVSGLLTNGIVASDAKGITVPSGFTRILAFRAGLAGDPASCEKRFP